ncbi:MAG: response regulator [Gammaproteobacteria bacterium]|nr:response regulator [Gammaproteobacteria bacterium]
MEKQTEKKKILIIDDELMLLLSMQRMLEDLYDITIANGGQAAIDIINKGDKKFDLIICDISMPDVNGANFYLYILKKYPGLEKRIIFMTGGPLGSYLDEFFTGSRLLKPFEYDELRKAIQDFLEAHPK